MTKTFRKTTALSAKNETKKGLTGKHPGVRAAAAKIILQVLDQGKSLSALIPEIQPKLNPRDLPLLQEICFGVCRVLPRLERIIRLLTDKPLKGKTRIVHCLLLVGLYQILYTRIPQHAAINEVVNAAKELKSDNFRGLLNGVLRRFLREQETVLATADKHWQTDHPEWLVNRLKQSYPNWRDIIDVNNQKPPMWLRVNQNHSSAENYRQLLAENHMPAFPDENPHALRLESPTAVQRLPHFAEGWVTVQDVHAQWSAILLDPQNGELILDACAAPGGKTTHILEQAPQSKVVALDVEQNRLNRITENLARLNQQAVVICGDATKPETWLPQAAEKITGRRSAVRFDRILLDAPCSATGVIRRHPDIKWLRQEQDIAPLTEIQYQILTALWETLKPNGVLLYATCSVLPDENGQQIARFLSEHSDARLDPLPFASQQTIGHQFLPMKNGGDGFYYAKLRKIA